MKGIFRTKFAKDMKRNGQEVEILSYTKGKDFWDNRYTIRFTDGAIRTVYTNEVEKI